MNDIGTVRLETDRLILRRLELSDANDMYNNWCSDDEVTRYLPWETHKDINVTYDVLNMWLDDYNNSHVYRWIVILKDHICGSSRY